MLATLGSRRFDVTHDAVVVAVARVDRDPVATSGAWSATPDAVLLVGADPRSTAASVAGWTASADLPVMVRTSDAEVLQAALAAGAAGGHDTSGLSDPGYLDVVVGHGASLIIGAPATPPIVADTRAGQLLGLAARAVAAGIAADRVVVDATRGEAVAPRDAGRVDEVPLVATAGWAVMVAVAGPGDTAVGEGAAAHAVLVPRGARVLLTADPRTTRRVVAVVARLLRHRDGGTAA